MINMSPLSLPFKEKTNLFYSIEEKKESSLDDSLQRNARDELLNLGI